MTSNGWLSFPVSVDVRQPVEPIAEGMVFEPGLLVARNCEDDQQEYHSARGDCQIAPFHQYNFVTVTMVGKIKSDRGRGSATRRLAE